MLFERERKIRYLRFAALAALVLLLSVLQNTDGFFPEPFGLHACLLIPVTVSIAIYEHETTGIFFGLFAGLLWDTCSAGGNYYAIFLVIIAYISGSLVNNIMRINIVTASLLSAVWLLVYHVGYFFTHFGISQYYILLRRYLPAFLYSTLLAPFIYLAVMAICDAFEKIRGVQLPGTKDIDY